MLAKPSGVEPKGGRIEVPELLRLGEKPPANRDHSYRSIKWVRHMPSEFSR